MEFACAIKSSVAGSGLHYFSIWFHNRIIFEKNVIEHKNCILFVSTILTEIFLILSRIERDMIIPRTYPH